MRQGILRSLATTVLAATLTAAAASADPVVIRDHRCVGATLERAHQSITDYDAYSRLPGARYFMSLGVFGNISLLNMFKSQSQFTTRTDKATDGYVWVMLQPVNLTDQQFYPKLLLHCTSSYDSDSHFSHHCNMMKDKLHYGLQDFISTLEVTANSPECKAGQTYLDYTLTLDGNPSDIEAIKREVTRPLGATLGKVVAGLFDVDAFFRGYYVNFYESWAGQL